MYDHLLTKLGFCYKIQTNDSQEQKVVTGMVPELPKYV